MWTETEPSHPSLASRQGLQRPHVLHVLHVLHLPVSWRALCRFLVALSVPGPRMPEQHVTQHATEYRKAKSAVRSQSVAIMGRPAAFKFRPSRNSRYCSLALEAYVSLSSVEDGLVASGLAVSLQSTSRGIICPGADGADCRPLVPRDRSGRAQGVRDMLQLRQTGQSSFGQ